MSKSQDLLAQYYPAPLFAELGAQFGFASENIQIRHLLGNALFNLFRYDTAKDINSEVKADRAHIEKALDQLKRLETTLGNIEDHDGVIYLNEVVKQYKSQLEFSTDNPLASVISEKDFLDISCSILRDTLQKKYDSKKIRTGRPRNKGLQEFTEYMRLIWTEELGRPFTLDYHKGVGTTPAFDFVKTMITATYKPTDPEIVSAMRFVVKKAAGKN